MNYYGRVVIAAIVVLEVIVFAAPVVVGPQQYAFQLVNGETAAALC